MSDFVTSGALRRALLLAVSATALSIPAMAQAQSAAAPIDSDEAPAIVVRSDILPDANPPGGALDNVVNVTGVGQMRLRPDQASTGGFVCSGTLVNPRTVIFAAHCVNRAPQSAYGFPSGGQAISFGFEANNLPAVRLWLGLASVAGGTDADPARFQNKTNVARSLYNVEQIWYDPRSLMPPGFTFVQADVALATLDTHADGVPTWAMLFSPLTDPTHALVNGYGARGANGTSGANLGVDSRRRIAENMIDFLGSLDDRNRLLFEDILGSPPSAPLLSATNYQLDFDDPAGVTVGAGGFNFDVFPGGALAREGTTAGGDSGGPLIVDQKYNTKIVAAVLSGGSRFFGPQPFSSYGTTSFYQPLFLYWDVIVANNPYVYASAKAGNRNWFDAAHWQQDLDPNYKIDVNGALVTGLPNTAAQGVASNTPKFGQVCYNEVGEFAFSQCETITGTTPAPSPTPIQIAGGPGTQNFVPNNTTGNRLTGARANYYEVTLNRGGTTTLSQAATIDRLNVSGSAALSITSSGNLTVLGDFTQSGGSTVVNGTLKTGEALVAAGQISGSGRIDPTFLTVMGAAVLPGGFLTTGSLTVQGDLILTSATFTSFDLNPFAAEKLIVVGDAQNTGAASLGGTVFLNRGLGAQLRAGQRYEIVTATGGVTGRFGTVLGGVGVLRPGLTYGPNNVVVTINAGSLAANVGGSNTTAMAFANALDSLRGSSYNSLYGLFGAIDVMDSGQLTQTLAGLMPRTTSLAQVEGDNQKSMVLGMVADRLSMLGTSRATGGSFKLMGAPETLGLAVGQTELSGSSASQRSFAQSLTSTRSYGKLPENVSGFLSGGYDYGRPGTEAAGSGGQRSTWHIAMGLEMEAATNLTIGTAFGYVNGRSSVTGTEAETRTSQALAYGSYRLSRKAYVAGLASVTHTDIGVQRGVNAGFGSLNLQGDTTAQGYDLQLETGVNLGVGSGLTLTPRAALRYSSDEIDGYRENGGELALIVDELKEQRFEARFGARMSGETALGNSGWSFVPELAIDRVQRIGGSSGDLTLRFASAGDIPIVLSGFSRDRSWTDVKGGLRVTNGKFSIGGGVESSLGRDDYRDNRAVADFTLRF